MSPAGRMGARLRLTGNRVQIYSGCGAGLTRTPANRLNPALALTTFFFPLVLRCIYLDCSVWGTLQ